MKLAVGDVVKYHGRPVKVLEVVKTRAPHSGEMVDLVRVEDPARGRRSMFRWQLEEGIGAPRDKALVVDPAERVFGS